MITTSSGRLLKPTLCPTCGTAVKVGKQIFPVDHAPDVEVSLCQVYFNQPGVTEVYCPKCNITGKLTAQTGTAAGNGGGE